MMLEKTGNLGEPSTSISLLERAGEGQPHAWATIVQLYGPVIYTWMRKSGFQAADAADLMQETLAAAFQRLNTFRTDQSNSTFRGWLWNISRNKAVDLIRRRKRHPNGIGGSAMAMNMEAIAPTQNSICDFESDEISLASFARSDLSADDDRKARASVLRRALAEIRTRFQPQTWELFVSAVIQQRPIDDIATENNVSKWAVYKARSRVLSQLREYLSGLEDV